MKTLDFMDGGTKIDSMYFASTPDTWHVAKSSFGVGGGGGETIHMKKIMIWRTWDIVQYFIRKDGSKRIHNII